MKKILRLLCWFSLVSAGLYGQNTVITNSPLGGGANGTHNEQFWSRRGNTNLNGSNNIFGTRYNASVYHYTNDTYKMKLNGDYNYSVNGFSAPRNGYLLIGQEQPIGGGVPPFYLQNKGAFTRLHLHDNSSIGGFYDVESGYRPWMRNGVYFSGFSDAGYLGQKANGFDNTDMIFTWSDNSGQDNMTFAFTRFDGLASNNTGQTSGDLTGDGINGREVMRFAASGNVGMGPRFDAANPPRNDLHIRSENLTSSFMQIDNQKVAVSGPTATSVFSGALFGMLGNSSSIMNGNVLLYNQENRHLLLGTNYGVDPVNTTPSNANEKVRITSVGAPTDLGGGGYGVNNPYTRPTNNTYVAISSNPANSIKRPYSLLHMGEDIPDFSGYRPWMYNGTLISTGTDQMYIGMKQEASTFGNRYDAVINWADDNTAGGSGVGADNLRFIYTQTTIGGSTGPGIDADGAEVARMTPDCPTCFINKPSMGIGDFSPTGPNAPFTLNYIGATLDIDGDLRIRTVTPVPSLNQVLVIDPLDKNKVHYRDLNSIINGNNGVYYNTATGSAQLGVSCTSPSFVADYLANAFTSSRAINLAGNNLNFGSGKVGFNLFGNCPIPNNTVEINKGNPNQSGLRFTQLTSISPSSGSAGTVLSVDGNGDVILVDNSAANNGIYNNNGVVQLGLDCGNPNFGTIYPNLGLTTDRVVNLNGQELTFDGNAGGRIGIGMAPCVPVGNRVEITGLAAFQSGLRFTNLPYLTSPSISPIPGTIPKYLTVDLDGDVILMDGAGGLANNGLTVNTGVTQLGQTPGAPGDPGQLLNNREVPMYNNNIYFTGQNANSGINAIAIGTPANSPLVSKMQVLQDIGVNPNSSIASYSLNSDDAPPFSSNLFYMGAIGGADGTHGSTKNYNVGVEGYAINGFENRGIWGYASKGSQNLGGLFNSIGDINSDNNFAVYGFSEAPGSTGGTNIFGGYFNIKYDGMTSVGNAAVYGNVVGFDYLNNPNPASPLAYAGYFNGDLVATGINISISDSNLKRNIVDMTANLDVIHQIQPKSFEYKTDEHQYKNLPFGTHYGLIAQNIEEVFPNAVRTISTVPYVDTSGVTIDSSITIKGVVYQEFIPLLIGGVKELDNKVESQNETIQIQDSIISAQDSIIGNLQLQLNSFQTQLDDMMAMITNCCSQGNSSQTPTNNNNNGSSFTYEPVNTVDVKLTDTYCVLGENSPNPFKDHTVIKYTISETIQSAQIVFYNTLGQVIKILDINDRGEGRLNVYAEDLRSGMYTYSLIIDGNVCETKKMIKE